ncbi:MAG: winged helix-turn-helix domain-containing protein [Clostridiales bacterium]|nr:winged helix-turn-helix domain-containing protein [Clostridiales bacterium]
MTAAIRLSREQARRFLLTRHGLMGEHRFIGPEGAFAFIRQAGSIQFDPIDVCGRNPDLVLQSRIQGYSKAMLADLLYRQRRLVDYFDKELCIFPTKDWPHFARMRERRGLWMRSHEQISGAREHVLAEIRDRGPLCSKDIGIDDKVHWFWGSTRLARATLEHLYYGGELGIHHKQGTVKYYDLIERCIPPALAAAPDPHPDQASLHRFLVLRRIGAVGMLWNRASAAWLGLEDFNTPQRQQIFAALEAQGAILPVMVEGIRDRFYCLREDEPRLADAVQEGAMPPRCELIAPLDNLIWDRKMLQALFDFDYTWEIYTPADKRRYSYYVLPLLLGDRFIGRAEPVFDKKAGKLTVKSIWYEEGVKPNRAVKRAVDGCLARFEAFHRASES